MESLAIIVMRIGLGITFILMGSSIITDIDSWSGSIDKSMPTWEKKILPFSVRTALLLTGVYDIANGLWLWSGLYVWVAALFAALHLVQVLVTTGVKSPNAFRDIGLLFASIALMLLTIPGEVLGVFF